MRFFEQTAHWVLSFPRPTKRVVAVTLDALICVATVWLAFYLRLDEWITFGLPILKAALISIGLAVPIFVVSGLYRAIFRYSGATALVRISQACLVYGAAYAAVIMLLRINDVPRTVGLLQPLLLFLFIGASRVIVSWWLGGSYARLQHGGKRHSVMIYGAGSAGRQLFQALSSTELHVIGFLDDNPALHGQLLLGRPIHAARDLPRLVQDHELTDILLALPSATRKRRSEILELIRPLPVAVRTVPGLTDVAHGRIKTADIRELEIDDLLGRAAVEPNRSSMEKNIRNRVVAVTGAGGSIGSELCRQILVLEPSVLLLIEVSEFALYSIHQELEQRLAKQGASVRIVPLLASVLDRTRMAQTLSAWRPHTIYHAAAYKHVPLVEHNPIVGIKNNAIGTAICADLAHEFGVRHFVLISTDKAVRPTNAMGASKRLAEIYLQALADAKVSTCFSMVRFGNVLGSSGSVVPRFREQIDLGGPVTLTHPDITRYFMTIPEAAQLVIQASVMASGGDVFVLDMGEPIRIMDLARQMITLSGLSVRDEDDPDGDIEIKIVGLRPGEKLFEELLIGKNPEPTAHPRIMRAMETFLPLAEVQKSLLVMSAAMDRGDVRTVRQLLCSLVDDYVPAEDIVDWIFLEQRAA
jgi:FlaA1/EpsC-like NDP-sugar epimerase